MLSSIIPKYLTLIVITLIFAHSPSLYAKNNNKGRAISNAWELPPLILNDLTGKQRNLYDWHGKVIMLNFWATWCGPCQIEIPDFINYQAKYAKNGLQVVGVGLDEVRKLKNFVRTVGINYPILQANPELQYSLLKQWGNSFGILPFTVIIGTDGHLIFMQQGILKHSTFEKIIKPLLTP